MKNVKILTIEGKCVDLPVKLSVNECVALRDDYKSSSKFLTIEVLNVPYLIMDKKYILGILFEGEVNEFN